MTQCLQGRQERERLRGNVSERTFAKKRSGANVREKKQDVHEGTFARESSRENFREGTFATEDFCVRQTFAKGNGEENDSKEIFTRDGLQGYCSSSTGNLHVVEFVHCIITPNTHG